MYCSPIERLIRAYAKLPSVGRRTAERYVFHLLKKGKKDAAEIANALIQLLDEVKSCSRCWDFSDINPCKVCADKSRTNQICVVAEPQDMQAMENTGHYKGTYHIIRGTVGPDIEISLKNMKVDELVERIEKEKTEEIILALNQSVDGESTMMLVEQQVKMKHPDVKVTRLARGLPIGSDLQYADEVTLKSALEYRRSKN